VDRAAAIGKANLQTPFGNQSITPPFISDGNEWL